MHKTVFDKALNVGRPPNIKTLFPNSKALIISGKFINDAVIKKNNSVCIAANGRNIFIIKGALLAAQRANSALMIEIAKSEGGKDAYCSINYWNIARIVDSLCNELKISIPIAIHADHYSIKNEKDISEAFIEIPTIFEAGITSIAIDASHLPDDQNLLTTIKMNKLIPKWSGFETEIGEIKGKDGLSTENEAKFMVQGLNAHNIFPDWIALNNGTIHGMKSIKQEIDIKLTSKIHNIISKYGVYGAQHGTSGNSLKKLYQLTTKTHTTKANIATALQMISWGLKVDESGNAIVDQRGKFIKAKNCGMSQKLWSEMVQYANMRNWSGNDYKKLNLPFENKLLSQSKKIKDRMTKRVENFIYFLMSKIFNSKNTAPIVIKSIIETNSYCPTENNNKRIENIENWTKNKIRNRAPNNRIIGKSLNNFDD